MSFGKKIQELRKETNWSQEEVAKKIGTSGAIIGRYERNEITPSIEVAKKIAKIFNVSVDFLLDDTGELSKFKDIEMLKRWEQIEKLPENDKAHVIYVIDAMLRDASARKAYSGVEISKP
jgi:transcriptional regulator with XRE-family HTH domain